MQVLSDAEWEVLRPLIEAVRPRGKTPHRDLRRRPLRRRGIGHVVARACVLGESAARQSAQRGGSAEREAPAGQGCQH